ncbi:hypothetical protein LTR36_009220 [Oleoguttula mirabilis]|uniref:MYND-type domain-containing protein n=1 Tax=Oleoguttula mirabilis TaxID=1507867 RepID=A0AAV9J6G6_9PEZI|nr:hypothetical protein LTR36_009220 [Oleoguttula mirabilis]
MKITPIPPTLKYYSCCIPSSTELLDSTDYTDIPLACKLGIPLRMTAYNDPTHAGKYNDMVKVLGRVVDPSSPLFGRASPAFLPSMADGCILVYRGDGRDFSHSQMEALLAYCKRELADLYDFPKSCNGDHVQPRARGPLGGLFSVAPSHDQAKAQRVLEKVVNPAAFIRFFEKYRAEKAKVNNFWHWLECPVDTADACGVCSGKNGKNDSALRQCGKCKKRSYCGRECQAKDLKTHKVACKAAQLPPSTGGRLGFVSVDRLVDLLSSLRWW